MKTKMYSSFIVLILFFFVGCVKNKRNEQKRLITNSISENKSVYDYKDFFKIVKEIDLESTKESIISFPFDIIVKNRSLFIISSRNSPILEFNYKGKFIEKVGRIGNGPGEYKQINSLFLLKDKIGIFDFSNQKITIYNNNNEYLREFSLPFKQVVSLRKIVTVGDDIYIHVPYTRDFPFYILELDTYGNVKRKFVRAGKGYSNYSFFGLFHGAIVKDETDSILYEMNSFSNNVLKKINLTNGTTQKIKLPKPEFYRAILQINGEKSIDEIKKRFYSGVDIFNILLLKNKYLVVAYVDKGKKYNQIIYVMYNLESLVFRKFRNLGASFSDGEYLYGLIYYDKNTKSKENLFSNPKLIITKLKESTQNEN